MDESTRRNKVTVRQIAAYCGVSRATVSLVLRNNPNVAEKTRQKVTAAMAELGYVYDRNAANLRSGASQTIGIIIPNLINPFFAGVTAGIDAAIDKAGSVAFLANTLEDIGRQERFLQRMREQNVDGVIICPAAGTPSEHLRRLRDWGIACVETLRYVDDVDVDYTSVNYQLAISVAINHLVGLGHRNIAFVGSILDHSALRDRVASFQRSLEAHGLSASAIHRAPVNRRGGYEAATALLKLDPRPTALVCYSDVMALGVLTALKDLNIEVGRDCSVVGCDDLEEAENSRPRLTSIRLDPFRIGGEAARLLLRRIEHPAEPSENVLINPRLIVRETSGPYRGA